MLVAAPGRGYNERMEFVETQWDGLVGLTHNYAGLSHGNVASAANALSVSHPKQAALQGLEKMRFVAALGIPQYILPPQPRPNLSLLRQLGFTGTLQQMLDAAWKADPKLLQAVWSASAMWAANAAIVSPAPDTADGKLHLTPANLASTLHRQQEAAYTHETLKHIFGGIAEVHAPLPACVPLTDEGAANQMRLCSGHGEAGVEVFVYGRKDSRYAGVQEGRPVGRPSPEHVSSAEQEARRGDKHKEHYPARQTLAASQMIARLHGVKQPIFVQQSPEAIDAGVFHNDVIAMSNENLLIYHEKAFVEEGAFLAQVRAALPELQAIRITEQELPLQQAVSSYFFNSQLLTLPGGGMAVVAPVECGEIPAARRAMERLPVAAVHYLDVRESMRNGGGPACLRLRVVMDEAQRAAIPAAYRFTEARAAELAAWIEATYPDTLTPEDLRDAALAEACLAGYDGLAWNTGQNTV